MKTFLDQIARQLLATDGNDLSGHCVVLPSRRAGVFLRDALSKAGKKTIWAPSILSIEDFVFRLSGMVKVEQVTLLFKLFGVYQRSVADPQPFELFANWAPIFLADVNEVDINLVDAEDIYSQLYSIERIARWNPSGRPMSDFQERHLQFVKGLYPLYRELRKELEAEKVAYQGLAFRHVAENAQQSIQRCPWSTVWFAGFNALTVSEEHIIRAFEENGTAKTFWDMDAHYVDDALHEAGFYFRKYASGKAHLKVTPDAPWKQHFFAEQEKDVNLIAAQRNVTQAEAAATILAEKVRKDGPQSLSNMAVVLNDEKLLFPLLNAMPADISGVNITMGYGLKYSQAVSFIDKLFGLYVGAATRGRFYHADVMAVVTHSVFVSLSDRPAQAIKKQLLELKKAYLQADELQFSSFGKIVFSDTHLSVDAFIALLQQVCRTIRQTWKEEDFRLELGFVVLVERLLRRLSDLQQQFGIIESIKTLQVFWHQLVNGQQLDFVGEPIGGLQVMGMLETRNLDFEEVIMLSVNEGSLPSNAHSPSYFTFDVRRAYGLACQNERDAVTAYHFYRLMQRAKKVHLIYDQDTESFGGGEVSRFVQQLRLECDKDIIHFHELRLEQKLPKRSVGEAIIIPKTEVELAKLKEHAADGFSPSALNTYRTCPLKFYMRYVAGFKEQDELVEDVDHAMFGTAIHDTLEELYKPTLGKPLTEEVLKQMQAKADDELAKQFAEHIPKESVMQGTNLLAFEVAKTYVNRVLKNDLQAVRNGQPNTVLQLEEKLTGSIPHQLNGESLEVHFKGMADRIDRTSSGTVRLIDYKTGSADKKVEIDRVEDFATSKADYAFQLLIYHLLYTQMTGTDTAIPAIFFLRLHEIEKEISILEDGEKLSAKELDAYTEELLSDILSELFDLEIPFEQTEDAKACGFCDFKQLCQR
ncbi:MAG: hypothetical protein GC178_08665 [Flavobacteriales bacterium]|nr:hypothetical protein [Flavobacteriales bacterium]